MTGDRGREPNPSLESGQPLSSNVGAHNAMPLPPPPPNWEANEIARFFDAARSNEYATFANQTAEVARLSDIDLGYRKAIAGVNHSKDWFAGFFLLRAHSMLTTIRN